MTDLLESENHVKSPDMFDEDDKLCVLPPGKMNLVLGEVYVMNHGKYSLFYYVRRYPPNALRNEGERVVISFVPKSREDDLVPK